MCDNNKFYICEHCGNLIGMINDAGVPIMCCGKKMTKLEAGTVEASKEKHIPVVKVDGNTVTVKTHRAAVNSTLRYMTVDKERFDSLCKEFDNNWHIQTHIGTYNEKRLHLILKKNGDRRR